jgi:hypothetical protein
MFGRLKDWQRLSTRYDRSPTVFLSAIALAAAAIFWICFLTQVDFFAKSPYASHYIDAIKNKKTNHSANRN